jgi:GxxExxY protein
MQVHSTLGNGFQEVIYQRCLALELADAGIGYVREQAIPIYNKDRHVGTRRADFIIEGKVLIELKAIIELEDVHLAQALNYLEAYRLDVGLLINFGNRSLQFKRVLSRSQKSRSPYSSKNPIAGIKSQPSVNPVNPDADNFFNGGSYNNE